MVIIRYILLSCLFLFLVGCAGLYESQPPAPVYRNQTNQTRRSIPPTPAPSRPPMQFSSPETPPVVKTQPLKEFNQALVPLETPSQIISPTPDLSEDSIQHPQSPEEDLNGPETAPYIVPESVQPLKAPDEVVELTPFQPIEPTAPLSPAVGALVLAANENTQKGHVDTAAASIDRALKIEPRNPALYYKLALIRLKQSKPQEAENLAKKSALLAAGDHQLKKHSWLLIAHAREMQKDFKGAREARAKAEGF